MNETKRPTCKQRWAKHKNSRFADLRKLWKLYQKDCEASDPDVGNLYEYGLSFDYVAPGTFPEQKEGYWRYQLSWGGPSDEIRFYSSSPDDVPYRITYCFMDWFDGHERKLIGRDEELARELWDWFSETGSVEAEYNKARSDV